MAEQVDLPVPVPKPSRTAWKVDIVTINVTEKRVTIQLRDNAMEPLRVDYMTPNITHPTRPTGAELINALNTANLTTNSLVKRIFNRLITDGIITGTVSGTPE